MVHLDFGQTVKPSNNGIQGTIIFHRWSMRANERTDERVAHYLHLDSWFLWPIVRCQLPTLFLCTVVQTTKNRAISTGSLSLPVPGLLSPLTHSCACGVVRLFWPIVLWLHFESRIEVLGHSLVHLLIRSLAPPCLLCMLCCIHSLACSLCSLPRSWESEWFDD